MLLPSPPQTAVAAAPASPHPHPLLCSPKPAGMAIAPLARLLWTMAKELKEDIADIAQDARRGLHHMLTSSTRRIQPELDPTGSPGPRSQAGLLSSGRQAAVAESLEGPEGLQLEEQQEGAKEEPHDRSPHEVDEPLTNLISRRLKIAPPSSDAGAPAPADGQSLRLSSPGAVLSDAAAWQEGRPPSESEGLDDPKWLVKKEVNVSDSYALLCLNLHLIPSPHGRESQHLT